MKGIMKPFSIDEYRKNPLRKIVTRDGRNAKIICTNFLSNKPIIAEIEEDGYSLSYDENGRNNNFSTPCDLFFAHEKHEGWLNIYRSDECGFYMRGKSQYKSKEEADKVAKANPKTFFTTIKVEWEE